MTVGTDRLFNLLPVIHRKRDAELGYPLRALLAVIDEQVGVVEDDIQQLYENWFIETCQEWVVPYIGSLLNYRPGEQTGAAPNPAASGAAACSRLLIPRREVANTIGNRQRKGTLRLLEELAAEIAGWPARAVEFYRLLDITQPLNHVRLHRGRTTDLRWGDALERLGSAFDELAHTVDVRRIRSHHRRGRYNIPSVGVFVWRVKVFSVTRTPAFWLEEAAPHAYTFSVLGNDAPLYTGSGTMAAASRGELQYPLPIRRRRLEKDLAAYYGDGKSLEIWTGTPPQPVPSDQIVVANLTDWHYRPQRGQVAVDPVLGRIAFPPGQALRRAVWVGYHYAFSDDIGGGEYERALAHAPAAKVYRVGGVAGLPTINEALTQWRADRPMTAIIEIDDGRLYVEQVSVELGVGQRLELRAANHQRPILRLLDWQTDRPNALSVSGDAGSRFILDGLLVTGRGLVVQGDLAHMVIRHCTLVPGSSLYPSGQPRRPNDASLELLDTTARVTIEHSILGPIRIDEEDIRTDPISLEISDSIVDATDPGGVALAARDEELRAWASLRMVRTTVFGRVRVNVINRLENSIVLGRINAGRRQTGCVRFSFVEPGSRTPRRYHCQPDLVDEAVERRVARGELSADEGHDIREEERRRVRPQFNGVRYGAPTYCQLADDCAPEIRRGADDESEMGVFHDLYQPQREANLQARLDDYVPIGMEAGIIHSS
jgi:hypothetical protein